MSDPVAGVDGDDLKHDDGLPWGWMCEGVWRVVPKGPLLRARMGPPPFTVRLESGEVREIIHRPAGEPGDAI